MQLQRPVRVAIMDMNQGHPNQGMRCLRNIVKQYALVNNINLIVHEYDVRQKSQLPDASYSIYFSTGGPGSPLQDNDGSWGAKYFSLIDQLYHHNKKSEEKKFVFFICHSFQLACRHFQIGKISKRKSTSFGVFPVHKYGAGFTEPLFRDLPDPFYAVDSRDWQVTSPDAAQMNLLNAEILAIEKERPHVPLERAIMAIRFSDEFTGTQFHPEADAAGMSLYLQSEEKKQQVIANCGEEKYNRMIQQLNDPDKIMLTQQVILPAFLNMAVQSLQEVF